MYESTQPSRIPRDCPDGRRVREWQLRSPADWELFPDAVHVRINVTGSLADGGDVLDVERGDATPEIVPAWVGGRRAAGARWHAVYCSRSVIPAVLATCEGQDVPKFGLWVADWTGEPHQVPGAVAVQYESAPGYDLSVVWDQDWHPAAA